MLHNIISILSNDILTFDLPVKSPSDLILTSNVLQNNCLHFLDLNIHLLNNKLHLEIYNRRTDFKFNVNTFAHFKSCLHVSVYRNIILNHLYRIQNLCSSKYKNKNL